MTAPTAPRHSALSRMPTPTDCVREILRRKLRPIDRPLNINSALKIRPFDDKLTMNRRASQPAKSRRGSTGHPEKVCNLLLSRT